MFDEVKVHKITLFIIFASGAVWTLLIQGYSFIENFGLGVWETKEMIPDFFQEWASARNYLNVLNICGATLKLTPL
jgi:hypothetical protein